MIEVNVNINGQKVTRAVEPRTHLGDFIRNDIGLTGTNLSCEHGVCGSCTVLVDGRSEEHTSELQSRGHLVCRLLLEKKNKLPSVRAGEDSAVRDVVRT